MFNHPFWALVPGCHSAFTTECTVGDCWNTFDAKYTYTDGWRVSQWYPAGRRVVLVSWHTTPNGHGSISLNVFVVANRR